MIPEKPAAPTVKMRCPNCGVHVRGKADAFTRPVICPKCKVHAVFTSTDEKKHGDTQELSPIARSLPRTGRKWLLCGGLAATIALAGLAIFLVLSRSAVDPTGTWASLDGQAFLRFDPGSRYSWEDALYQTSGPFRIEDGTIIMSRINISSGEIYYTRHAITIDGPSLTLIKEGTGEVHSFNRTKPEVFAWPAEDAGSQAVIFKRKDKKNGASTNSQPKPPETRSMTLSDLRYFRPICGFGPEGCQTNFDLMAKSAERLKLVQQQEWDAWWTALEKAGVLKIAKREGKEWSAFGMGFGLSFGPKMGVLFEGGTFNKELNKRLTQRLFNIPPDEFTKWKKAVDKRITTARRPIRPRAESRWGSDARSSERRRGSRRAAR